MLKKVWILILLFAVLSAMSAGAPSGEAAKMSEKWPDRIKFIIENIEPLKFERGDRLPIYAWGLNLDLIGLPDSQVREILSELDKRGFGWAYNWNPGDRQAGLKEGIRVGRIQQELGLGVNINANSCLYSFFNGDEAQSHIDQEGNRFSDPSFGNPNMGCPFTLAGRYDAIKEQVEYFVRGYKDAGVEIDFVFADWEVDGPIEWNDAWENSKRCVRCKENIEKIDDFDEFQKAIRIIRSDMQKKTYADVLKEHFPAVLVGNYGVYPDDGYRYWYDYFEKLPDGAPFKADQKAKYRRWYPEFELTGYTYAMPTVYTWYQIFDWYDFENTDYRWFYNMLLVASNPAGSTPANVPIISHVHWHTTDLPKEDAERIKQFSREMYKELLWHMLLRGHDAFISWCLPEEFPDEITLIHEVYAAALEYREFLDKGAVYDFKVPHEPGSVISGLRLGNKMLFRRTDFDDSQNAVVLKYGKHKYEIPRRNGQCQVIDLEKDFKE